ncbi:hypothetical protein TSAR_004760 [Trichomalopsis sarcophagae]|uniref:Uncharacterized protein n=1 Tax=Trichomalopsis sarcophagae TaxID=543379 RepID=A0A232FKN7_9HYME|nr:hypothetical protein TSAR_004760 [Trichomalopsis sarcophagae]
MDVRWRHPRTCMVCGLTSCSKTVSSNIDNSSSNSSVITVPLPPPPITPTHGTAALSLPQACDKPGRVLEHARKMILVLQKCIESVRQQQQQRQCLPIIAAPPPPSKLLSQRSVGLAVTPGSEVLRLDDEINKILNSSKLDDLQKCSMDQQMLQRFLHYTKQSNKNDEAGNELLLPTVDKTLPPLHSITTNSDGEVILSIVCHQVFFKMHEV